MTVLTKNHHQVYT